MMRRSTFAKGAISVLVALVFSFVQTWGRPEAVSAKVLREGTPVLLRVEQTINSETANLGDILILKVARDVEVDGEVVISQGTAAEGQVIQVSKRGMLGKEGEVGINVRSTKTVSGKAVPLRGTLTRAGKEKETLTIILTIVLCVLFILMKGEEGVIPAGSELKAYTDTDIEL